MKVARSEPPRRNLREIFRFVAPHWRSISLAVLFLLGETAMDLLKPWPLKWTLDIILPRHDLHGITLVLLIAVAVSVLAISALEGLWSYLSALHLNRAGRTIVFNIRAALFDRVQRLSLQYHSRRSAGDLLTRVTSDVRALRDVLTESFAEVVESALFLTAMIGVLMWLDRRLAYVVLAGSLPLIFALTRYTGEIQEYSRAERRREGALATVMHESLGTIRMDRVFNREDRANHKFEAESRGSLESGLDAALTAERFSWAVDVLGAAVTATVLGFGVQRVASGAMTAGTLVVFVTYVRSFYKPLRRAVKHVNKITRASAQIERVAELLQVEEGVMDLPGARPAPRIRGEIEFRGVSFAYESQPVLDDIDLVIAAGEITAVVGPTGAGKTTLVSLVPRLYDPIRGSVRVDGLDVRALTLRSLRAQISMVFQETVLLQASIGENIAYGRPGATRSSIIDAAKAANAHEFIRELPDGYDTMVGERGETLSGGQRQRIAIARAIVRDGPIVILDEPLTGLDAEAASVVLEALERLTAGRTVLLITHDLSIMKRSDRVIVICDGRVAQDGSHRELERVDGPYRDLCQAGRANLPVSWP